MGNGASLGVAAATEVSNPEQLVTALSGLDDAAKKKLQEALAESAAPSQQDEPSTAPSQQEQAHVVTLDEECKAAEIIFNMINEAGDGSITRAAAQGHTVCTILIPTPVGALLTLFVCTVCGTG